MVSINNQWPLMNAKELRAKSKDQLQALLHEKRSYADALRFNLRQKKVKNVKELREVKKDIARILTFLSSDAATLSR